MDKIEITNEYDIKILNLIFKKLFDNQIDYSTKQINEILNREFSFFKRKRIIKQTQESSTQLFSQIFLKHISLLKKCLIMILKKFMRI